MKKFDDKDNGGAKPSRPKPFDWTTFLWILLGWMAISYMVNLHRAPSQLELSYTEFKKTVQEGEVAEITVKGDAVTGVFKQRMSRESLKAPATGSQEKGGGEEKRPPGEEPPGYKRFQTTLPSLDDPGLLTLLEKKGVVINAESDERSVWITLLVSALPWVLIIGFFIYSSKKMQERMGGGGGGPFGFGKSKAKLYRKSKSDLNFENVAGLSNAKKELLEVVEYLKDPGKYKDLGGKLPNGILLVGPPGTGKTLMARAVAGEADVPFFSISGSEFIEMFVGVGASRVRDMFKNAKKEAPSIIFIDEIDSIGRVRGTGLGGGHDEREQTLNQILAEMDGFSPHESIVVMAATNRPDVLDPALVRPGRFDRRVTLELPRKDSRKKILEIHARDIPLASDADLETVARRTVGFSGADLENLVNEAALLAARRGKEQVEAQDFEEGADKIIMGIEREDLVTDKEKETIAYHEAGHALTAKLLPNTDPLKKVTIIPRGRALGATEQLPEEDRYNLGRRYLLDRVAVMLGGRVSEQVVFDDVTSGAGDDLKKASQLVRRMICQWGMSDKLGPVTFNRGEPHPFLGRELTESRDFSEHTARLIDEEVRGILVDAENRVRELLQSNRHRLDTLARSLLDHETLSDEEIDGILEEQPPVEARKAS